MSFFSKLFQDKQLPPAEPLWVDMHSHLLPGIDDGVQSLEESCLLITELRNLGYRKLITTPHINADFFKNTPDIIHRKLKEVKDYIADRGVDIEIEAAAEYYLDEEFISKIKGNDRLLTFGENYLLFETPYLNEPARLHEIIFEIKASGYWPVLAHPERYIYLHDNYGKVKDIYNLGISFQLNINSLTGYYNRQAENFALKLISDGMVNFAGSDCHAVKHLEALKKTRASANYQKLLQLPLLNNSLL